MPASTVKKVLNLDRFQLKKRMIYINIIITFSGLLGSFVFFMMVVVEGNGHSRLVTM